MSSPSPNHGGMRSATIGCVIHSTRGGADSVEDEFQGTLNWFRNPASQVSAHDVIANDGTVCYVVDDSLQAWHAGSLNSTWLGIELCQSNLGDPISDAQVQSLAWRLQYLGAKYRFQLTAQNLPFHSETSQGVQMGKSDAFPRGDPMGAEFRQRLERALAALGG